MSDFNWPIIGHQDIQEFLQAGILNNNLSHAYLFYGPQGVGKSIMAEYFAMSIVCLQSDNTSQAPQKVPCDECAHCLQNRKKIHPDVAWYERMDEKKEISIEQIREIIHKLSTTSFLGSYKIGIILDADTMSLAAANSLLKTLEEPNKKTVLILTAQNISNLPKTILSRCLLIKFLPVTVNNIYKYLINEGAERAKADSISRGALGLPGRAINFYKSKSSWLDFQKNCQELIKLINAPLKDRIQFVDRLLVSKSGQEENRRVLRDILDAWAVVLRDLILLKNRKGDKIINTWAANNLFNISQKIKLGGLLILMSKINQSACLIRQNVNPKMILEDFLIHI